MFNYTSFGEDQATFYAVVAEDQLPVGQQMFFSIDEYQIVLINQNGRYFAIADVCSHDNGPVGEGEIVDDQIKCPRHGARFDLATGKALSMPAHIDIPAYPVRIQAGMIEVGIPKP